MSASLVTLQQQFQQFLLHQSEQLLADINDGQDLSAKNLATVYSDAYRIRLQETLMGDYPALRAYLGEEEFLALTARYIQAHPSQVFNVRYYGRFLAQWLDKESRQLSDLANFQWQLDDTLDAADAVYLTLEDLQQVNPEQFAFLQFHCHPSVRAFYLKSNAIAVYQAVEEGTAIPRLEEYTDESLCLCWRYQLTPYYRSCDSMESFVFEAFRAGNNFAEVCEALCEKMAAEQVAQYLVSLLQTWVSEGVFMLGEG